MSVFEKVFQEYARKRAEKAEAEAQQAATAASAERAFAAAFHAAISTIAKPLFEEFAKDAQRNGFPSRCEERQDDDRKGNPSLAVTFIPVQGAVFERNESDECTFKLMGFLSEQKVEQTSYFDQRPGKNGVTRSAFGIESIEQTLLEQSLADFLRASLSAHGYA